MICKSHVQRVEGCKHITCPICDYEWCWDCGRQYKPEHEQICPKKWSPMPPELSRKDIWKREWRNSSKVKRVGLAIGGVLISPIMLLIMFLFWPLWYKFNMEKHLNKRNPIKSLGVLILTMFMSILIIVGTLVTGLLMYFCSPILLEMKFRQRTNENNSIDDIENDAQSERRWTETNADNFAYTTNARSHN